jgi:hypothetical protein
MTPSRERACRREHDDLVDPRTRERICTRRGRRPGRQDVVDQDDGARSISRATDRFERAAHDLAAFVTGTPRLRRRRDGSTCQANEREPEPNADGARERIRLVVATFGQPAPSERHPGDSVRDRRVHGHHGVGEGARHAPPAGELQPMDRGAGGTRVGERRPDDADGRRRAVGTVVESDRRRAAAPLAPRWTERLERGAASAAERPAARAAARASRREHHVERPSEHGTTLAGAADTGVATRPRAGPARSGRAGRGRRSVPSTASA